MLTDDRLVIYNRLWMDGWIDRQIDRVLLQVLLLLTVHHDQGKCYKGQHLIWADLQVQRFSPLSSRWEHGSIQTVMVQEELRVLHLHPKEARSILASRPLEGGSQSPSPSGHTYSNKATHLLIVPLPGSSIFKPPHQQY